MALNDKGVLGMASLLQKAGLTDIQDPEIGDGPLSAEQKNIFDKILKAWESLRHIEHRLESLRQPTLLDMERAQNEAARAMREAQAGAEKAHSAWPTDKWVRDLPETLETVLHGILLDRLLRKRREVADRLMGLLKSLGALNGNDGEADQPGLAEASIVPDSPEREDFHSQPGVQDVHPSGTAFVAQTETGSGQ